MAKYLGYPEKITDEQLRKYDAVALHEQLVNSLSTFEF